MLAASKALNKKPFKLKLPKHVWGALAFGYSVAGKITGNTYPLNLDKMNELKPDNWICENTPYFVPQFDLHTGISKTVLWYQENKWL